MTESINQNSLNNYKNLLLTRHWNLWSLRIIKYYTKGLVYCLFLFSGIYKYLRTKGTVITHMFTSYVQLLIQQSKLFCSTANLYGWENKEIFEKQRKLKKKNKKLKKNGRKRKKNVFNTFNS